jgi:hypothetical protein
MVANPHANAAAPRTVRWRAGHEAVMLSSSLKAEQVMHIKASMATTPWREAIRENAAITGHIISIGIPTSEEPSEKYRAPGTNAYLIDGKLVNTLVSTLSQNAAQPVAGSYIDVRFRAHGDLAVSYRAPGAPSRLFGGPVPAGTSFESVPAHNIRSIQIASRAVRGPAAKYDFMVYSRGTDCDFVRVFPRNSGLIGVKLYTIKFSTSTYKC